MHWLPIVKQRLYLWCGEVQDCVCISVSRWFSLNTSFTQLPSPQNATPTPLDMNQAGTKVNYQVIANPPKNTSWSSPGWQISHETNVWTSHFHTLMQVPGCENCFAVFTRRTTTGCGAGRTFDAILGNTNWVGEFLAAAIWQHTVASRLHKSKQCRSTLASRNGLSKAEVSLRCISQHRITVFRTRHPRQAISFCLLQKTALSG